MSKREQSPIYQTRSTRVLFLDDVRREGRRRRLAFAAVGLIALIVVAALIGQGLRVAAEPSPAPAAGSRSEGDRERVVDALTESARPTQAATAAAPTAAPTAAVARALTVTGTEGNGLRLRTAPGLNEAPVAVLPEGSAVTPTGRQAEADELLWLEVRTEAGLGGWAAADYLR